jgi:hypothetical protein
MRGDSAGDAFGASVDADDLNDDGYADVVVGAPGWDGAVADQGAVYVFLGSETRFYAPLSAGEADVVLEGAIGADATGGRAGEAVSIVGNMGGSAGLDLVIGAPDWNDPYVGYGVGAAFVRLGPWQIGTTSLEDAEERFNCPFTESEDAGGCRAGEFVGPAGDLDGDGLADALVSATGWFYNGSPDIRSGALVVIFGRNIQ